MSEALRLGFIGCGKIAAFHADAAEALGHKIDCVCAPEGSGNIQGFSARYQNAAKFSDYKKMVLERKPDALIIAVSWDQTEKIISGIIQTGLPCLVEKPVALSSQVLEKILSETKKFNDQVLIAYNRRFYDFMPQLKTAIETERLLSVHLKFPETIQRLIQTQSPAIAEHVLVYLSSHWFDLLRFLLGDLKVEWVSCKKDPGSGIPGSINGILTATRFQVPVHIQGDFDTPANTSLTFNFRQKIYHLCPIEQLTVYEGLSVQPETAEIPIKRFTPQVQETLYVDTKYKPGFLDQMRYFIDAYVRKTSSRGAGCTLNDALAVTKLCEQIKDRTI